MKYIFFIVILLYAFGAQAIGMDDFVFWYPKAVGNTLNSDILPDSARYCFNDYRNNVWKPGAGYSAYEFGLSCMHAVLNCDTSMEEDAIYDGCAKLAVRLIAEQEKYLDECKSNPDYTVCSPVVGTSCQPEGGFHLIEHKNVYGGTQYDVTTERIVCKNGLWQKAEPDSRTVRAINMQELQETLYTRCVNHGLIRALGGETDRYFDCDLKSRKCLIVQEADSKDPTTWWFCCKLFNDGQVALYDGYKGTDGKIEDLKKHLRLKDLCADQSWLDD